ncbi:hypothetical protein niasHS_000702 [Heterodera schachtii]|uniref:Ras-associating domain-containing protein n=1 Tax=Heterodera schachtii TaxID=97005 RepID=A0ABD2KB27_HETSC
MAAALNQREKLCETIERWNATAMDMFAISLPDENMEFRGVIRFHLHEQQRQRRQQQSSHSLTTTGALATKCMRVSSMDTVAQVVDALVAKFHAEPNAMHMAATTPAIASHSLWEVHDDDNNGMGGIRERHMDADERPLLVQLGWCCHNNGIASGNNKERSDGSERWVLPPPMHNGRFVLRRRLPKGCHVGSGTLMIVQFKKVRRANKRHVDARASGLGHQNRPIVPKLSWGDKAEDGQDGKDNAVAEEMVKHEEEEEDERQGEERHGIMDERSGGGGAEVEEPTPARGQTDEREDGTAGGGATNGGRENVEMPNGSTASSSSFASSPAAASPPFSSPSLLRGAVAEICSQIPLNPSALFPAPSQLSSTSAARDNSTPICAAVAAEEGRNGGEGGRRGIRLFWSLRGNDSAQNQCPFSDRCVGGAEEISDVLYFYQKRSFSK